MSRQVRIEFPGATYHVMCRGDRREDIFRDDGTGKCCWRLWRRRWRRRAGRCMQSCKRIRRPPDANDALRISGKIALDDFDRPGAGAPGVFGNQKFPFDFYWHNLRVSDELCQANTAAGNHASFKAQNCAYHTRRDTRAKALRMKGKSLPLRAGWLPALPGQGPNGAAKDARPFIKCDEDHPARNPYLIGQQLSSSISTACFFSG